MAPRTARRPAADKAARRPSAGFSAGQLRDREAYTTSLLSVYSGRTCVGFLVLRGKAGVEAYDADDNSLGIFSDQQSAAAAISKRRAAP